MTRNCLMKAWKKDIIKNVMTKKERTLFHRSSEKRDHAYSKGAGAEDKHTQKIALTLNGT